MKVGIEEIVNEKKILPRLPYEIQEIKRVKPKNGRLSRNTVKGLIAALKEKLDQEPYLLEAFVLAQIAGLPTLLVGAHGSGKTTMVKTLASAFYIRDRPLKFKHITVKEIHTEYNVFARPDFGALAQGREKWIPKLIEAEFPFIDEIFRNHRIMAALNEVLEEKHFEGLQLKWLFFAAATNPPNQYYKTVDILNYADLDRFAVIIEVEDRGFGFADKMISGFKPELDLKIDVGNLESVREEIKNTKVSAEASSLAKMMVAAFSVCNYEPVKDGEKIIIYNKFSVLNDLKCYRCIHQQHNICPRYALAPKRALRSLIALAKARAWVLSREVREEDVVWAFKYTIPGRTAIISQELKETVPTYKALHDKMLKDFREWFVEKSVYFNSSREANDPLLPIIKNFVAKIRVHVGYRVVINGYTDEAVKRLAKWFIVRKGTTAHRAAQIVEKLTTGLSVIEKGFYIVRSSGSIIVEKFADRSEAEDLCNFIKK